MSNYYKPSGKFSPLAFLYFVLACVIVFPILSAIYAYATWYIPLIYINVLITIGFGFGICFIVSYLIINLGKVRSYGLAILLAILSGLVAYYLQWVVWSDLAINGTESYGNKQIGIVVSNVQFEQLLYLLSHPSALLDLIKLINENGTWGIKGNTISGGFLTAIWVAEFAIIMFFSVLSAKRARLPFDEQIQEWFKEENLPIFSFIENEADFKKKVEQGDWEQLSETIQRGDEGENHSTFTVYASGSEYYLSVSNAKRKESKKDKIEFDIHKIIEYLHIDKTVYDMLRAKA
ncbi:hypothetical protein [Capnocytophaga sp. oral taxon 338]|uniref:hypothetical protein n=1 Tax=Capnocytophaga sp. oral taxon 338 TaxID=710239 RepID=UPI000202BFF7|nr:hypothetical protein [Capnocytophaga sp. oral taxon 338]EGD34663.1 hypothetical protein HMPREF9071_0854 [Capnocytophaga sp. oral taxon 338 str. F0234]